MQILRIYIENFGKLSDTDIDFQSGCNIFCRENGWGKSSLAVFICAMFYGLGNDSRHDILENERKHYQPWQGGNFGGNLTFADEKGLYTIYRSFGAKAKEDRFELRDALTNLPSDAYSERVGEELFQIDRDAFIRTAFLYQNSCETTATSSINAKIHNLAEDTTDMNNYDAVNRRMLSEITSLGESRSTGKLARLKKEAAQLQEEIRQGSLLDEKMKEAGEQKEEFCAQLRKTEQEQENILRLQDRLAYDIARKEAIQRKQELKDAAAVFGNHIPSQAELDEEMEHCRAMEKLQEQKKMLRFSRGELAELEELEEQFAAGIPDEDEIDEQFENISRVREIRMKSGRPELSPGDRHALDVYSQVFGPENGENWITEGELDAAIAWWTEHTANRRQGNNTVINTFLDRMKLPEFDVKRKIHDQISGNLESHQRELTVFGLALFLVMVGIGMIAMKHLFSGIGFVIVGLVVMSVECLSLLQNDPNRIPILERMIPGGFLSETDDDTDKDPEELPEDLAEEPEDQEEADAAEPAEWEPKIRTIFAACNINYGGSDTAGYLKETRRAYMEYLKLLEKGNDGYPRELKEELEERLTEIRSFLAEFTDRRISENELEDALTGISRDAERCQQLEDKCDQYEAICWKIRKIRRRIREHLGAFGIEAEQDLRMQVQNLYAQKHNYDNCVREYEKALAKAEEIRENAEAEDGFFDDDQIITAEQVSLMVRENSERMLGCQRRIQEAENRIRELQSSIDKIAALRIQMEEKQKEIRETEHQLLIVTKAQEIMAEAQQSFTRKYMAPIMNSFLNYFRMLDQKCGETFLIDAESKITVLGGGIQRETGVLSRAYQDMTGLCIRMALLDAMYPKEKPFVLMDDPFVNLDEKRLQGGMEFLKEISSHYQIIYLTCHSAIRNN